MLLGLKVQIVKNLDGRSEHDAVVGFANPGGFGLALDVAVLDSPQEGTVEERVDLWGLHLGEGETRPDHERRLGSQIERDRLQILRELVLEREHFEVLLTL